MKALKLEEKGCPPSLRVSEEPELEAGEARVRAAALNHRDVWIMHGMYPGIVYPIVLGSDGSGVVTEVSGADQGWMGKEVVINPCLNQGWSDARLRTTSSAIYEKIAANVEESTILVHLRDTLLPKLLSGELPVKDADHFVAEAT